MILPISPAYLSKRLRNWNNKINKVELGTNNLKSSATADDFWFYNESEKSSANCGIFSYRGAYSLQNLLDKKKDVFVNKEYVGPFDHRTAPP